MAIGRQMDHKFGVKRRLYICNYVHRDDAELPLYIRRNKRINNR